MANGGGASAYNRFPESKWRLELLYGPLLRLPLESFKPTKLLLILDDALFPKWGKQLYGTDSFFSHTDRPRPGHIWGYNWVVLAVVVGSGKYRAALPFWIGLYRAKEDSLVGQFRTRQEMAVGVIRLARALFPGQILLLIDGVYAKASIITQIEELKIKIVSQFRSAT